MGFVFEGWGFRIWSVGFGVGRFCVLGSVRVQQVEVPCPGSSTVGILAFQRINERPHFRERSTSVLAKEAGWKEVAKEGCDTVGAEHSA